MKLSIIIPVWNNWNYTKSVLSWFKKRDIFEVIVVNNGSTDDTKKNLIETEKNMNNLISIHNDENLGFGAAVNLGINKSSSSHCMILNNDIMIGTNSDQWALSLISSKNELVGPTGGFLDDDLNFKYETNSPKDRINYMSGWCLCASREVWDSLVLPGRTGPFDNKAYFCYFEDTDLSFRAKKQGIDFKMVSIPVHHIGKQTSRKLNTNSLFMDSKKKFIERWGKSGVAKEKNK